MTWCSGQSRQWVTDPMTHWPSDPMTCRVLVYRAGNGSMTQWPSDPLTQWPNDMSCTCVQWDVSERRTTLMCCRQLKASTSASSKALSSHRRPVITLIMQPDRSCQSIYLSVCLSNTSELLTVYGTLGAVCSGGCHRQHDRQGPSAISRRRLSVNSECRRAADPRRMPQEHGTAELQVRRCRWDEGISAGSQVCLSRSLLKLGQRRRTVWTGLQCNGLPCNLHYCTSRLSVCLSVLLNELKRLR